MSQQRRTILLVDDDASLLQSITWALEATFDVLLAHDGEEALNLLHAGRRYDLILSDLLMPVRNGQELHEAVEQIDQAQAARMAFMTACPDSREFCAFTSARAGRILQKPFGLDELHAFVAKVLQSVEQAA